MADLRVRCHQGYLLPNSRTKWHFFRVLTQVLEWARPSHPVKAAGSRGVFILEMSVTKRIEVDGHHRSLLSTLYFHREENSRSPFSCLWNSSTNFHKALNKMPPSLAKEWGKGEAQRCYTMVSTFTTIWTPIGAKRPAFLTNCSTGNGPANTHRAPSLNQARGRPTEQWREALSAVGNDQEPRDRHCCVLQLLLLLSWLSSLL